MGDFARAVQFPFTRARCTHGAETRSLHYGRRVIEDCKIVDPHDSVQVQVFGGRVL